MPKTSDSHVYAGAKKPEYCAWRTFRDGRLEEAKYKMNGSSEGMQIFKDITKRTVKHASFFESIDNSDPDPPGKRENKRDLDRLEKDLLRLSKKKFNEKYPNMQLFDTRIKTRKVGERIIEETD